MTNGCRHVPSVEPVASDLSVQRDDATGEVHVAGTVSVRCEHCGEVDKVEVGPVPVRWAGGRGVNSV
jgi:hypothetical protein